MKRKIEHMTATGRVDSRTTAADYTHVLVGEAVYGGVSGEVEVISWHKSEAAAVKAERPYSDPRASYKGVGVEPVNGGHLVGVR